MRSLPTCFKRKGLDYKMIKRTEKCALYGVGVGSVEYYEVFIIGHQKGGGFNGIVFEEKELYPSDEKFGASAWCCSTLDSVKRIIELKNLDIEL